MSERTTLLLGEGARPGDRAIAAAVIRAVGLPAMPALLVFAARGGLARVRQQALIAGRGVPREAARDRWSLRRAGKDRRLEGGSEG